jgi:hypothetical protein
VSSEKNLEQDTLLLKDIAAVRSDSPFACLQVGTLLPINAHASIVERQFIQRLSDSNANGNGGIPSQNVGVLDGPTSRTRGELTPSEEALQFGWASWAIHGLFKKLTDCGDAS